MKKRILICLLILVGAAFLFYLGIQNTHTFTLADREGSSLKEEQIQPVFGTVQVSSSCDTAVVFTDTETGETYEIGYLTPGIREKIRLRRGRWYTVTGAGSNRRCECGLPLDIRHKKELLQKESTENFLLQQLLCCLFYLVPKILSPASPRPGQM